MIKLNAVPLNFEPRQKILPKLPQYVSPRGVSEPEMTEFDSAFLCGALKTFRPKKILEVGVAGGATTAIILQTLENIGEPYEMHSIDVAERYFDFSRSGWISTIAAIRSDAVPSHSAWLVSGFVNLASRAS